jgi:type 1 glutamine amidotransferase
MSLPCIPRVRGGVTIRPAMPRGRACVVLAALGLYACAWACGASPGGPSSPVATTPPAKRLLVVTYTTGFRHSSIPIAETTLRDVGTRNGLYQTEFCRTEADVTTRLTPAGLRDVDAVFFANTTGNLGIPNMTAFLAWIAAGHGFLGAHSASDTYHDSAEYLEMLGGEFATHGQIAEADIRVDDPSDPSVAHLAPRFRITDELYRFTRNRRSDLHVLLSMDRNPNDGVGDAGTSSDLLMAWRRSYGDGRVFYTALGHREEVWQDARFQQHLLGALRWALGS